MINYWKHTEIFYVEFYMNYFINELFDLVLSWSLNSASKRKAKLRGENGARFGREVCQKLGFGADAYAFLGNFVGYRNFIDAQFPQLLSVSIF